MKGELLVEVHGTFGVCGVGWGGVGWGGVGWGGVGWGGVGWGGVGWGGLSTLGDGAAHFAVLPSCPPVGAIRLVVA